MTKDLSKQLCELCGIEYEKQEPVAATNGVVQAYSKTTLDFTKPENFVRLFDLKWYLTDEEYGRQEANLSFYVLFNLANSSKDWNTEGFIRLLVKALKEHNTYVEPIKQSIREAEWVYEA